MPRVVTLGLILAIFLALVPGAVQARANAEWPQRDDGRDPWTGLLGARARAVMEGAEPSGLDRAGVPEPTGPQHYIIQAGDTLWGIAVHFGVGMDVIARANDLNAGSVLSEGMDLIIPYSNVQGSAVAGPDGPVVTSPGLHFVASISAQACWLFRDGNVINHWTCSTGRADSPSVPGNYTVQTKELQGYSAPADAYMPYWLGIYDAGTFENGIHGLPFSAETGERYWTDKIGVPITFGCIMLDDQAAPALYDIAYIGMPVTILP